MFHRKFRRALFDDSGEILELMGVFNSTPTQGGGVSNSAPTRVLQEMKQCETPSQCIDKILRSERGYLNELHLREGGVWILTAEDSGE